MTVYRRPDPIPLRRSSQPAPGATLSAVRTEADDLNRLVAKEIFQAIASGRFPAGSILPNEHQLAADLGVSRTALREAIKGLVSKGLVETRRKRGTLVLDQSRWNMLDAEVIAWSRRAGPPRVSEELWAALVMTQPTLAGEAARSRQSSRIAEAVTAFAAATSAEGRRLTFGTVLLEISRASGNRFLASMTSSCIGSLVADDGAFLDRVIERLDAQALRRLPGLIAEGGAAAARDAMQLLLNRETVAV